MSRKPKNHDHLPLPFEQVITGISDEQKPETLLLAARPFLKWVGGKRSLLPQLEARLPLEYTTYHEPFIGGGALFFEVQPRKACLTDINFHLVLTFQAVRDEVDALIKQLKIHGQHHDKDYFLKARDSLFGEKEFVKIAALFIYLNKTCYNGLYRVNKSGKFNVPMGSYKDPAILDEDNLRNASKLLQGIDIQQRPFTQTPIVKGDFYYLDPPYHKTYDGYSGQGFADAEHEKLAQLCHDINKSGGYFMLSNSDTEFVRKLYKIYSIEDVMASRMVSCKSNQRGKENELIIRNY
ncbi:MAG: DNA adenine methylase [Victivallaceae bacterium]